jgi:hypothetical protein
LDSFLSSINCAAKSNNFISSIFYGNTSISLRLSWPSSLVNTALLYSSVSGFSSNSNSILYSNVSFVNSFYFTFYYVYFIGIIIFFISIAVSFIGYTLVFGNLSYYGVIVILGLVSSLPSLVSYLVQFLFYFFSFFFIISFFFFLFL